MMIAIFLFMLNHLSVKFISQHVNRAIHIIIGTRGVQIVPGNVECDFNLCSFLNALRALTTGNFHVESTA